LRTSADFDRGTLSAEYYDVVQRRLVWCCAGGRRLEVTSWVFKPGQPVFADICVGCGTEAGATVCQNAQGAFQGTKGLCMESAGLEGGR
jgi:hypothetical protein